MKAAPHLPQVRDQLLRRLQGLGRIPLQERPLACGQSDCRPAEHGRVVDLLVGHAEVRLRD